MKLAKILDVLKNEPLFCVPGYRGTLLSILQDHAELSRVEFDAKRAGRGGMSGSKIEIPQMEVRDNLAIIPVGGPIGMGLSEFEKGAGAVDVDDIKSELEDCLANDEIENVILNFDTPGGMVTGTPELAQYISDFEKPKYAWSRGQMCSAGYYLASSCDGIFTSPTADSGCIGVCTSFFDLSRMADMAGIKVKVFGSGDYKGMGTPGTSLTAQQEVYLQQRIMSLAQMFYSHVRSERGQIEDADMQGQTFKGEQALEKGLIDGVMQDMDELITFLS